MYKNRFILVLGLLSTLLVGMVVTQSRSLVSSATGQAASDLARGHNLSRSNSEIPSNKGVPMI